MARAQYDFSVFDPASYQTALRGFDFTNALKANETINGATVTISVISGTDPSVSSRLIGPPNWSGPIVMQEIGGLIAGVQYELLATITTSLAQTFTLYADQYCLKIS